LVRVIPLLVVAFIVGSLFRMANEFGVGLFRMFGTFGIAVMGVLATRIVTGWQVEGALRELGALLKRRPQGWRVEDASGDDRSWQGCLAGQGRTLAVVTTPVANYSRGRSLARALGAAAARAKALAAARQATDERPVTPCVVLLRRRADDEAQSAAGDVLVLDLDGLAAELGRESPAGGFASGAAPLL